MAPIVGRGNLVVLASEKELLFIDISTGVMTSKVVPSVPLKQDSTTKQVKPSKDGAATETLDVSHINMGTCLAFSSCSSFLAACTPDKNLIVWKTCSLEVVAQWKTARKISSLVFNSKGDQLIVADKTGDCFAYSVQPPSHCGKLVLGHLSMLLDVAITCDDRYIITSERDEKIRVSCFPNAYSIHTFCLGHTEFVTSLALLEPNSLLSGSGDGTLRLWDYSRGKLIHTEKVALPDAADMESAVRFMTVFKASESIFLALVLLNKGTTLMIYKGSSLVPKPSFECQNITLNSQPLAATFLSDGNLLILTDDLSHPLHYLSKNETHQFALSELKLIENITEEHLNIVQDCIRSSNGDLKPLFKRWFDNVQTYRERKVERSNNKSSSDSGEPLAKTSRKELQN